MTPVQMQTLLYYYYAAAPLPEGLPGMQHAVPELIRLELIEPQGPDEFHITTPRGNVFVKALLTTPLPQKVWAIPEREEE